MEINFNPSIKPNAGDINQYHDAMKLTWDDMTDIYESTLDNDEERKINFIIVDMNKHSIKDLKNQFIKLGIHDFGFNILLASMYLVLYIFPGGVEAFKGYQSKMMIAPTIFQ